MTDETKGLSHEEIEEGILNGEISTLESSESSDDEVDLSFSPTKPFSPLVLETNPRIEASFPKLSPNNIFRRFLRMRFWMSLLNIPRYPISTVENCAFSSVF